MVDTEFRPVLILEFLFISQILIREWNQFNFPIYKSILENEEAS